MAVTDAVTRYHWVILSLAFSGQLANALGFSAPAPLAPLLQPELGLSKVEVGLLSSAMFAGTWCTLLLFGTLADRVGVRAMLAFGQVALGACLLAMFFVSSYTEALIVMVAGGLGSGAILPAITKSIVDWFPPRIRATVMGIKQAAVPVGGMITAATLPAIGLAFGWRAAIAIIGVFALGSGFVAWFKYREKPRPSLPASRKAGSGSVLGAVLRNRRIWSLSVVSVMYVSVQMGLSTYLALYMMEDVLASIVADDAARVVAAGGFLAICQLGGAFGRVFWGYVSDRAFGGRRMLVMMIIGMLMVLFSLLTSQVSSGLPLWLTGTIVFGYGATAIGWNALFHVLAAETAGQRHVATGVAMSMTLNQIGTISGAPLFGFVVDAMGGSYQVGWLFLGALSLVGATVAAANMRGEE